MIIEAAARLDERAPRSLAEHAYQRLVHMITRLEISAGAPLVEKTLTEELGIGRTPVREALQRLAAEGLICHLPHRGMFVCEFGAKDVQYLYEFRGLIEGNMARLAGARASEEEIDELAEIHGYLVEARDDGDVDRYVTQLRRFYEVQARAAQNTYIIEAVPRMFNLHLWLWFFLAEQTGSWQNLARSDLEMTRGVVDALKGRLDEHAELVVKLYVSRRHQEIQPYF